MKTLDAISTDPTCPLYIFLGVSTKFHHSSTYTYLTSPLESLPRSMTQ